ncbi:31145_t:CDS:2 [Racocetra persica]|uniref:31145_t:CDS:1 n=1 Tax=Racocetra persica TaxID=160502 RepID=A0ACA9MGY5_9GLOM|nr:31145_t:CDS:2 [Racocetra persica]
MSLHDRMMKYRKAMTDKGEPEIDVINYLQVLQEDFDILFKNINHTTELTTKRKWSDDDDSTSTAVENNMLKNHVQNLTPDKNETKKSVENEYFVAVDKIETGTSHSTNNIIESGSPTNSHPSISQHLFVPYQSSPISLQSESFDDISTFSTANSFVIDEINHSAATTLTSFIEAIESTILEAYKSLRRSVKIVFFANGRTPILYYDYTSASATITYEDQKIKYMKFADNGYGILGEYYSEIINHFIHIFPNSKGEIGGNYEKRWIEVIEFIDKDKVLELARFKKRKIDY